MTPTLFAEIYRMRFSASYDPTQESTWHWLTNENIQDFTTPCYTREDPPHPCMMKHEGHRPKMLLWMIEEFIYIMGCLCDEDRDGHIVLGHELLLLVWSQCCRKRGGGRGPHHASALLMDSLPACSPETLECIVWALKDTISLECLTWAVYDNILVLGPTPRLSGMESYGQVVRHLMEKAYKGLHMWCPGCTSMVFVWVGRLWSIVTIPWRSTEQMETAVSSTHHSLWREGFSMMQDIWESAKSDQATGGQSELDPIKDMLKWMKECQWSYMEEHLGFWTLLHLLMDHGEAFNWLLACQMLSVWHWASALNLLAYPPAPSQLNIGHWIREDCDMSERQKWIEAYACMLQHLVEASVGHSWTMEGQSMTPEVSKLVDTFLAAMGIHMSPHIIRECWPMPPDDIPQQNLEGCAQSSCSTWMK